MTNEVYSKMQGAGEMVDADVKSDSIYARMEGVHHKISILSETLDCLVSRLRPILVQEALDAVDEKASSILGGSESPLQLEVVEVERSLVVLADIVRNTLNRVDL